MTPQSFIIAFATITKIREKIERERQREREREREEERERLTNKVVQVDKAICSDTDH